MADSLSLGWGTLVPMDTPHLPCFYFIEIYEPDSADEVLFTQKLQSPPAAMHEGDLLTVMPDADGRGNHGAPLNVLRVTRVDHIVWGFDAGAKGVPAGFRHKVMVFTTAVENTREIRHDRSKEKPYRK